MQIPKDIIGNKIIFLALAITPTHNTDKAINKDMLMYMDDDKALKKRIRAMFELAKLFESGLGTSYSKEKAIEWYKRCVESNYRASDDAKEALKRLGVEGY